MPYYEPDYTPSMDDSPSWYGEFESFNGAKNLRESNAPIDAPPLTESDFDDTYRPRYRDTVGVDPITARLNQVDPIIDGEHQTLLSVGEILEADEGDEDDAHVASHRLELANPKLNEAQRRHLLKHIESHRKNKKNKLRAVAETSTKPVRQSNVPSLESKMDRFTQATKRAYSGRR